MCKLIIIIIIIRITSYFQWCSKQLHNCIKRLQRFTKRKIYILPSLLLKYNLSIKPNNISNIELQSNKIGICETSLHRDQHYTSQSLFKFQNIWNYYLNSFFECRSFQFHLTMSNWHVQSRFVHTKKCRYFVSPDIRTHHVISVQEMISCLVIPLKKCLHVITSTQICNFYHKEKCIFLSLQFLKIFVLLFRGFRF